MDLLDLVLIVGIVGATIGGYRLGFVARSVSWIGLAIGLFAAVKLVPPLLHDLGPSNPTLVVILTVGLLLVGASVGQAVGFVVGGRLSLRSHLGLIGVVDRGLGALAGLIGAIVIIWLLVPVFEITPGWLATQTANSAIARRIDESLPPAPDAMQALRTALGTDAFPDVFDVLRPSPARGPPPASSGLSAETAARVARSVVKIEGAACSKIQDGSGFVIADGIVATNAHVVAGERSTSVERDDGTRLDATVVAFDPDRDLALLRVPSIDRPALPLASTTPTRGTVGGVFGHPGGEPLRIAPFDVARSLDATGRDIYGGDRTSRSVLELAASLRPGDSGSALVDPTGTVVGVAFAIARDRADVAYALAPSELRSVLAGPLAVAVDTGPCLE